MTQCLALHFPSAPFTLKIPAHLTNHLKSKQENIWDVCVTEWVWRAEYRREKREIILNNFQNEESLDKKKQASDVKFESEKCFILVTKCLEILNNGGNDNTALIIFCVLSALFVSLIFVICLVLKAHRLSPQSLTKFILHYVLLSKHSLYFSLCQICRNTSN